MSRVYTVSFGNATVSSAQDLFVLGPGTNKPIEIVGIVITQVGNTDVGDAQEELVRYSIIRGHTSTPVLSNIAVPVKPTAATAGFLALVNQTSIASGGTPVTIHEDAFNIRSGLNMWWPDGTEPGASAANTSLVVRLVNVPALADPIVLSGTLYIRELG